MIDGIAAAAHRARVSGTTAARGQSARSISSAQMQKMMKQMTTGEGPFGRMAAMMGRGGGLPGLPEGAGAAGNGQIHVRCRSARTARRTRRTAASSRPDASRR